MKLKINASKRSKRGKIIKNLFVTFTVFSFLVIILAALVLYFQPGNYAFDHVAAAELESRIFFGTVVAIIISAFLAAITYMTRPI